MLRHDAHTACRSVVIEENDERLVGRFTSAFVTRASAPGPQSRALEPHRSELE